MLEIKNAKNYKIMKLNAIIFPQAEFRKRFSEYKEKK